MGMAGLAGCAGILGDDDAEAGSVADVTTWLPEPREIHSDLDHYEFSVETPAAVAETFDELSVFLGFDQNTSFGSLPATDVEYTVEASMDTEEEQHGFEIYIGDFDAEWIGTQLRSNDNFSMGRDFEEFSLYERDDDSDFESSAVAVSGEAIVEATHFDQSSDPSADAVRFAELLIDSNNGTVPRYAEADVDLEALVGALPDGHEFSAGTFRRMDETDAEFGRFRDLVGRASSERFSNDAITEAEVFVFSDVNAPRERDFEIYIEDSGRFSDFPSRPTVTVDGRIVTIEGRRPL